MPKPRVIAELFQSAEGSAFRSEVSDAILLLRKALKSSVRRSARVFDASTVYERVS